jgi:uncharacterized membrane protein YfcA
MADLLGEHFLSWPLWIWGCAVATAIFAGIIRGLTGFGFPLIFIGSLTLVASPTELVQVATLLDIIAGVQLFPKARKDVDWRGLRWLVPGILVGVPIGVAVLVNFDEQVLRLSISIAILASVIGIMSGFRLTYVPGPKLLTGTGFVAGLMSGGGGIPGPPLIIVYLSSPLPVKVTRANTIALFLLIDTIAIALQAWNGLIVTETLLRTAVLIVVTLIGTTIGARLFGVVDPAHVKRVSLVLLAVLAIAGILKVLLD